MKIDFDLTKRKDNFKTFKEVASTPILEPQLNSRPKTTIAIPTYKRARLLKEAIDSALNQVGYDDYEILVVDNDPERYCETEKMLFTFNSPKIRYYKNKLNIEMFGNWNRCIELALGDYITILNDDDLLHPKFLFHTMKVALKTNKLIYAGAYMTNSYPFRFFERKNQIKNLLKQNIEIGNFVVGNQSYGSLGLVYKTENMKGLGGFDRAFFPSADYVFNARYVFEHSGLKLIKKLAYYRILENESIKESNLTKWPRLDSQIKKEISRHAFPNENRESLLLYALLKQKRYLESQWGANITFTNEEQRFIKNKYKLYTLKNKITLFIQIIKGTFHGTV